MRTGLLPVRDCPRRPEPVKSAFGVLRIGYADSWQNPAESRGVRTYREQGHARPMTLTRKRQMGRLAGTQMERMR